VVVRFWWLVDKRALLVTTVCLVTWRLLNQVPVIDVTHSFITTRLSLYDIPGTYPAIGSHSIAFEPYSLNHYGIAPYVQVLIVASVAIVLSERLRALVSSEKGRLRVERWLRVAAILFAGIGAYAWTLSGQGGALAGGLDWFARLAIALEMAAGTGVMIFLAGALDEYGLGFGYGAVIFYALDIFADGLHRVADFIAYAPSLEALYRPLAVAAAFTIAIAIAGIAIFLAFRRVWFKDEDEEPAAIDLKLVMPGVLRPGLLTFVVLGTPLLFGRLAGHSPSPLNWFLSNWSSTGSVAWIDGTYIAIEAALIIFLSILVVAFDWLVTDIPWVLEPHGLRLAVISGIVFGLLIAGARPLAHHATEAAGVLISVSGFNVLLVVAVVLSVILCLEGRRHPFVTTEAQLP
jgi:preprotein translocase subunit SecY